MIGQALLTIIVPTYNRAECLERLLRVLEQETRALDGRVAFVIGDNASTDETPAIVDEFKRRVPEARTIRHAENLGADENFCRCIELAESRYFWVIGDDDFPRPDAVRQVLRLLDDHSPDLLYLESDWRTELNNADPGPRVSDESPFLLDRMQFACKVHVWSTFISAMVVNRQVFVALHDAAALRRFRNTNLVQLGWVFETLRVGSCFIATRQKFVMATRGNSGGYGLLTVFGANFTNIVSDIFGPRTQMTRAILSRVAVSFLPGLIWSMRFGRVGAFDAENLDTVLRPSMARSASFWLLLRPIGRWPRPAATAMLQVSLVISRFIRVNDRVRASLFASKTVSRGRRA